MTNPYESPQIHDPANQPAPEMFGNWLKASFVMNDELRRIAAKRLSSGQNAALAICVVIGGMIPMVLFVWMFLAEWTPDRFGPKLQLFVFSSMLWAPGSAVLLCFGLQRGFIRENEGNCRQHSVLGVSGPWKVATDLNLFVITTEGGTMGWQLPQIRFEGHSPLLVRLQPDLRIAVPVNRHFSEPEFDPDLEAVFRAVQSPAEGTHALQKSAAQPRAAAGAPQPRSATAKSPSDGVVIDATFDFDECTQRISAEELRQGQKKKFRYVCLPAGAFAAVVITANMQPYIHTLWQAAAASLFLSPIGCILWSKADKRRAAQRNYQLQMSHPIVGAMGRWQLKVTDKEVALTTPGGSATWPTDHAKFTSPLHKPLMLWLEPDLIVALPEDGDYGDQTYLQMGQRLSRLVKSPERFPVSATKVPSA